MTFWQTNKIPPDKTAYRAYFRNLRHTLSAEVRLAMDARICDTVARLSEFEHADTVLFYYPIGEEPNLLALTQIAQSTGKKIAFPLCADDGFSMTFHAVASHEALIPGKYRIPAPAASAEKIRDFSRCLCLVPALSFDTSGYRIGYGKGYYDRFLKEHPVCTAGIVYSSCLCQTPLPREAHDRPVSILITEEGRIPLL